MARLKKRGAIWYAWIPRLEGGTRLVTTNCTDRHAASIVQARLEREAVDPAHTAQAKATVNGLVGDLLRALTRRGRSPATYSFTLQKAGHLVRLLPELAAQVTHAVLEAYVDQRLAEGAARTTVKKELGVLRSALRLARRNGLFARDPAEVLPELDDSYKPRTRALTPGELWALVARLDAPPTCGGTSAPHRARHVAFIVATAARWGESLRARPEDVEGAFVRLHGTKTKASRRTVAVPPFLRPMLAWASEGLPFPEWGSARRDIRVACAALGIEPCSPNDLRRTHATWLRNAGVEPGIIASQLGHTTSRLVEMTYGRLTPDALGKLLEERTARVA